MKFHLHDSAARKSSESYTRIREAIILKIQKTFDDSIVLTESIISKTKKVIAKPKLKRSARGVTDDLYAVENDTFMEEYKIYFTIYLNDEKV